jgi:hypothetical protein
MPLSAMIADFGYVLRFVIPQDRWNTTGPQIIPGFSGLTSLV